MIDNQVKYYHFFTPVLMGLLLFLSNFLSTNLFDVGLLNFTVWFVLSVFVFSCGWFINQTFGWMHGGKVIFSVIIASSSVGIMLVLFFSDHFGLSDLLSENLILYTLRNVVLGAMGYFGMALSNNFLLLRENEKYNNLKTELQWHRETAIKEAENIINEAKQTAEKIIFEAEQKAANYKFQKEKVKSDILNIINTEKELLKKYQN